MEEETMRTGDVRNTFLDLENGVHLYRFAGEKVVRLIGKRPAKDAMPAAVYEIVVNKPDNKAVAIIEGKKIFEIETFVGGGKIEQLAVSALHRFVKNRADANNRKKARKVRAREAREAAAGANAAEPGATAAKPRTAAEPWTDVDPFFTPRKFMEEVVGSVFGSDKEVK